MSKKNPLYGIKKFLKDYIVLILIVIVIILLCFCSSSLATWLEKYTDVSKESWLNVLGTLLGAFVGAYVAVEGANISQRKMNKEIENEKIKESAIIIYYDLLLGLNDVRKLYISINTYNQSSNPKEMFFTDNWIREVAILRKLLFEKSKQDKVDYIEFIYSLYGKLLTIRDNMKNGFENNKILIELVDKLCTEFISTNEIKELIEIRDYFMSDSRLKNDGDNIYNQYLKDINKSNWPKDWSDKVLKYPAYAQKRELWIKEKLNTSDNFREPYKSILNILKNLVD